MDNFEINIRTRGKENLRLALQLAFTQNNKATHYLEDKDKGLILFWTVPPFDTKATKFLTLLDYNAATDIIWNWLQAQPKESYKDYLDHDGDNCKAFRVYNEEWCRVKNYQYSFVAIQPCWGWLGK